MTTYSSAGTTFAIAEGEPSTYDEVGFAAQDYKNIGKIKNGGEFGSHAVVGEQGTPRTLAAPLKCQLFPAITPAITQKASP